MSITGGRSASAENGTPRREQSDPIAKGTDALYASVASIIGDDELDDKQAALAETFDQYADYLQEHLAAEGSAERGTDMDICVVAKRMAETGHPSCLYSRRDFYDELMKRAQAARRGDETREQSFTRLVTTDPDGVALFKAHRMSPGHDPDLTPAPEPVAKTSPALDKLRELARALHEGHPELTPEMAFAKVYADPRNRELAAAERAENRPNVAVEKRGGTSPVGDRVHALASSLAQSHPGLSLADACAAVLQRNPALARSFAEEQAAGQ